MTFIGSLHQTDLIYFSAHYPGYIDLVIEPNIDKPFTLSIAAAETLMENLKNNINSAKAMSVLGE